MSWFSRWRALDLGLILILMVFISGCASDAAYRRREARAARDMGERFLQAGKPGVALRQFVKALKDIPDDPYLHYDLALAYDAKGAMAEAETHLKEAIRLKPNYSEAYNYLGVIYFRRGQVDRAIEAYKKALANLLYLNPQHAHFNLGVAYLSRKQYARAVEQLQQAVKLVPDYAAAYNSLGKAYEGLKKYPEARRAYEKAVEFAPRFVEAHLNLGKLLFRIGETQAAAKSFAEVMRLAPESEAARQARHYLDILP